MMELGAAVVCWTGVDIENSWVCRQVNKPLKAKRCHRDIVLRRQP